jgi:hypothetical protein
MLSVVKEIGVVEMRRSTLPTTTRNLVDPGGTFIWHTHKHTQTLWHNGRTHWCRAEPGLNTARSKGWLSVQAGLYSRSYLTASVYYTPIHTVEIQLSMPFWSAFLIIARIQLVSKNSADNRPNPYFPGIENTPTYK